MNVTFATESPAGLDFEPTQVETPRARFRERLARGIGRVLRGIASGMDWLFGAAALVVGLSVLSAIPVAQFLGFGYLLEASGRIATSGRLRDGFVGVRKASRLGSMAIGVGLLMLPLRLVSSLANSAQLVDPGGSAARAWKVILVAATILVVLHGLAACARGGRARHFLMPFGNPFWIVRRLRRGGAYASARDAVWDFVARLRLAYYFRLGLLGFVGTMVWLVVPVSLIAAGRLHPLFGLLGAVLLGLVVMPLPYLQARFACGKRFRDLFALRSVRARFKAAPWAFAFSLIVTLVGAVPLYLLKIEIIPREAAWLPSLVFLIFMFPARALVGWAYGRSLRRERPRNGFVRWSGRLAVLPVAAAYVAIVFLSQFTAWRGIWSLYEQHAFLLPVPFLGL